MGHRNRFRPASVPNEIAFRGSFRGIFLRMRSSELTKKQLSSIPCPACGVPVGHRCLVQAGGLRVEPHMSRKLAVVEAIERKGASSGSKGQTNSRADRISRAMTVRRSRVRSRIPWARPLTMLYEDGQMPMAGDRIHDHNGRLGTVISCNSGISTIQWDHDEVLDYTVSDRFTLVSRSNGKTGSRRVTAR